MNYTIRILCTIAIMLLGLTASCGKGDPINNEDPRDLTIVVSVAEDESGLVSIEASAINTILYSFYISIAEDAIEENSSGKFEYTFVRSGTYEITIRAYGTSGKYVRTSAQVKVSLEKDVSIEDGYISPLTYEGYELVWNDEFDGDIIQSTNWKFEIGTGCPNCGWGNNELEYYRRENAWIENGVLSIEAKEEKYKGMDYTSARLITKNLRSFKYGRIDIRALLPRGQGIWPALWMLGNNISSAGWPECGEIDIMEMIGGGGRDNTSHGTLHWDASGNHASIGDSYTVQSSTLSGEYHVFSIVWMESSITWFVNNEEFYSVNITPAEMSEFHQEFFIIMNLAVGGNWPGSPDSSTIFPQKMKVDYVRVFQK
ncbi:MAG: glycoside hydrolase family 16 protein [Bacteroidetes bacterium]|jgi:beta-glucanase (GH16 family)|nr:glycoside hydrolase family 16 protein [Bacteroidota bacterium]MBT3751414.1 glycoside hydrolase family 16 protein [Bacteroidota bacterium]MBT4398782.1 glycoside hydrolase family 16 protein [Bacteroidota bacterium]MBT4412020.1 glycoside hydrolase family 16 protein [Bacteroidota bacterium]MBT5428160.1 glycoside hydrolase family 16 protein [Bacteroidota bacterium]